MRVSFTTFPLSENHFAVSKMSSSNVDWRTLITLRIYAQLGIEVSSLKKGLAFPFFLTKITASPLVGLFCSLNKQCADQEHVSVLVREIDKKIKRNESDSWSKPTRKKILYFDATPIPSAYFFIFGRRGKGGKKKMGCHGPFHIFYYFESLWTWRR